jgi:hypothetical protein
MNRKSACLSLVCGPVWLSALLAACAGDEAGNAGGSDIDSGSGGASGVTDAATGGSPGVRDAATGGASNIPDASVDGAEPPPPCGNGIADTGETCDTGVAAGQPGSCPTIASCDDQNPCTIDAVLGSECTAECDHTEMAAADAATQDQCCPPGATSETDADCSATCGNGVVDDGESCDTAIASGAGSCIASCQDDGNACTLENLNAADPCNPICTTRNVTTAASGDYCCPAGATTTNDGDCVPSAFRMTSLVMLDPHPFIGSGADASATCTPLIDVFNATIIAPAIAGDTGGDPDGGPDGNADLSFVFVLRPERQTGSANAEFHQPDCPMQGAAAPVSCSPRAGDTPIYFTYSNHTSGDCLAADPATVAPYDPPVPTTTSPCAVTAATDMTLIISGVTLPFKGAVIAGRFDGNPAAGMVNGLFRGFLSEADAATAMFSGLPISSLFPDGTGACSGIDDRDVGPDGTTVGWWWYMSFEAQSVTWTGP